MINPLEHPEGYIIATLLLMLALWLGMKLGELSLKHFPVEKKVKGKH